MSTSPIERVPVQIRRARVLTLAVLGMATIAAFAGVAWNGWIAFDDTTYVYQNPHISRGLTLDGLRWMMSHPHGSNFHPLTSIAHMIDVQLFGLDPRGPHVVNLALHVGNVLLLCGVLARYTNAWWRSASVAALFGLHPLRVESVAWISERKDVLCTLFFLLALDAYRRWTLAPTRGRSALLVTWFVLGLLAKPMLVTLPFVLLLLDIWPLRRMASPWTRSIGPLLREKLGLFALTAASCVATFLVQHASGTVQSAEVLPLGARSLNAVASYARYLGTICVPIDLAIYYPNPGRVGIALPLAALALLSLATILAWKQRRDRPWLLVGWLWFLGTLVPVIGIVQVGDQAFADRYTYIPGIGIAILLAWGAAELAARSRVALRSVSATVLVVLVACGVATARQVRLWKDTRTLFEHTLRVTHENAIAHDALACYLLDEGETDAAIAHLEEALRLAPVYPDGHNDLGIALGKKRRFDEAIEHFHAALRGRESADAHQNLGWVLAQLGRRDEAIREYEAALALDPDLVVAHKNLGGSLLDRGRLTEAVEHLRRALELTPDDVETHRLLAITRTLQGRVEEGIAEYRAVLARAPRDLDALNNIAWIRATHAEAAHRDGAEAVRLAELARDASHDPNAVLASTLAAAYAEVGRFDDAVLAGERAVDLARAAQDEAAVRGFAAQLDHYRAHEPFHQ